MKKARVTITSLNTGHIPPECDGFPMENSKTKKEALPMAAHLGTEGWRLELELRDGSQDSQERFIPFLEQIIEKARSLTSRKILSRRSARRHDALDTRVALAGQKNVSYIIK